MIKELVHEIHASAISAFLECRREWHWAYRERWAPFKKPLPLEFGSAWHCGLEELYQPDLWASATKKELFDRAHEAFRSSVMRQRQEYLDRIGHHVLSVQENEEMVEALKLGRNMLQNLVRGLNKDKYKPIAVEQEFERYLTDDRNRPLYCRCDECWQRYYTHCVWNELPAAEYAVWVGLPIVFRLRADAIFEDEVGSRWLVDHKSAAQLLAKEDVDVLHRDIQLGTYLWVLNKGEDVVCGAIYNQFRKAYPKPPKRLQSLQQGRIYSVNRQQLTDYWTARRYFQLDKFGWSNGLYNDYLEWLKGDGEKDFFRQFIIFKTAAQLAQMQRDILSYTTAMLGPDIFPTPNKFHCRMCRFKEPCNEVYAGYPPDDQLHAGYVKEDLLWYERERLERSKL